MHRIEDVYESAEDAEKEAMLSYLLHHARACEDPQAIAFLESLNPVSYTHLAVQQGGAQVLLDPN